MTEQQRRTPEEALRQIIEFESERVQLFLFGRRGDDDYQLAIPTIADIARSALPSEPAPGK